MLTIVRPDISVSPCCASRYTKDAADVGSGLRQRQAKPHASGLRVRAVRPPNAIQCRGGSWARPRHSEASFSALKRHHTGASRRPLPRNRVLTDRERAEAARLREIAQKAPPECKDFGP